MPRNESETELADFTPPKPPEQSPEEKEREITESIVKKCDITKTKLMLEQLQAAYADACSTLEKLRDFYDPQIMALALKELNQIHQQTTELAMAYSSKNLSPDQQKNLLESLSNSYKSFIQPHNINLLYTEARTLLQQCGKKHCRQTKEAPEHREELEAIYKPVNDAKSELNESEANDIIEKIKSFIAQQKKNLEMPYPDQYHRSRMDCLIEKVLDDLGKKLNQEEMKETFKSYCLFPSKQQRFFCGGPHYEILALRIHTIKNIIGLIDQLAITTKDESRRDKGFATLLDKLDKETYARTQDLSILPNLEKKLTIELNRAKNIAEIKPVSKSWFSFLSPKKENPQADKPVAFHFGPSNPIS